MRFQTKMTLMFAAFILLAGVIIALAYHAYSTRQYQQAEEKNLEVISQQISNQMDELIKPMETRMQYILSDIEILQSIRTISDPENPINARYMYDARSIIQKGINLDYVVNDFFRVIIFNQAGEVVSRKSLAQFNAKTTVDFDEMPWLARADTTRGAPIIVAAHSDNWGQTTNPEVFSLVKAILGDNLGYIEVQRLVEDLEGAIALPKDGLHVVVLVNGSELLYANTQSGRVAEWDEVLALGATYAGTARVHGEEMLLAKTATSAYGVTVLVYEDMATLREGGSSMAFIAVGIALVFCFISLAFVFWASHVLSKPLRQLRGVMEQTRLENIEQEINVKMPNNELEALGVSYQNVLERLQDSIVEEKRVSLLHLQAQFDLLQAQVNPHFLYNVLNVIAQRGLQNGDEEICNLCASLAAMLRYSTNTKQRYATVREELDYLNQYFYLLKSRFGPKLSFSATVDAGIQEQTIPKIVLQQIVENSINHAFENTTTAMRVEVDGWCENGLWLLRVRDNGQGFAPGRLKAIEAELAATRTRILQERGNMEMEIGGMGLVNNYARLLLMYGEKLVFRLENGENGGAEVTFGAPLDDGGGE